VTTTVLAYFPSPSQGVWYLGPVPLRAYALCIVAGMLAALWIGEKRWVERGGEPGVVYTIFWWAMPFGLIGGRLYHVITDWRTYFGDDGAGFVAAFRIWEGGLGIWGAVALGGVGAWIGCRREGIPLPAFGDAVAPGIVLAQAIGRLGNYFNQELYGRPTTLPWGLEIYEREANGVPDTLNGVSTGQPLIPGVEAVHPTFLYELLWNLLVFAALIYVDRRFKIGHGRLFAMYVAGYCVGRFWIELMRSDAATHIAGIRINSFTATFVFIGAVVYIMVAPKGREDAASLKGKPRDVEEEEDTAVEDFVKELTGVAAATTGVVAAAKVAGEAEDEDAKAAGDDEAGDEAADEDQPEPEAAVEAEQLTADIAEEPSEDIAEAEAAEAEDLGADVAGVPAENVAEAEEFAAEGEEEPEAKSEAAAEAEALAEDVEEAPSEDIAGAEEFAEAEEAAGEADEAEAEEIAAEGEDEPEAESEAAVEEAEEEPSEDEAKPVAGVGAVEGEEAIEAEEAAPEVDEAVVEAAEEAEDTAAEAAEAEPEPSGDEAAEEPEPETADGEPVGDVGGIGDDETVEVQAAAPEELEAVVEAADETEEAESEESEPDEPETAEAESAGEDASAERSEEEAEPVDGVEAAAEAEDVAAEVTDSPADEDQAPEAETEEPSEAAAEPTAPVDDEAETEEVAAEPEDFETEDEAEEPETGDAEAAVHDAEAEPSNEEAAEEAEAVIDEAEAAEEESEAETLESEPQPEAHQAEASGGRLRRWLRGRRTR
jgi:prolipoprotein diacylglyceryl transferase